MRWMASRRTLQYTSLSTFSYHTASSVRSQWVSALPPSRARGLHTPAEGSRFHARVLHPVLRNVIVDVLKTTHPAACTAAPPFSSHGHTNTCSMPLSLRLALR